MPRFSRFFLGGCVSAAAAAAASVGIGSSFSSNSDNKYPCTTSSIARSSSSFFSRNSYCESSRIQSDEKCISTNANTEAANAQMLIGKDGNAANFDALIIGGGVVGLAVTQALASRGVRVCMLEKENAVAAGASSGNSGLGCTGYDSPVGSLERRLLRRSIQLHQELYRSFGLSYEHVKKCGSLVVAWNDDDLAMLEKVLEENREAGDFEAVMLDKEELQMIEPGISDKALGAVFCPREAVVEPWLVPIGYAMSARLHGAEIRTGCEAVGMEFDPGNKLWFVKTADTSLEHLPLGRSPEGELLVPAPSPPLDESRAVTHDLVKARVVINCAGLHGDQVEHLRGTEPNFTITPRKGQFVVFEPGPDCAGPDLILERVPSLITKGVIIFTTVYGNIVVGPTATDQEHRSDRSTDLETVEQLKAWAATAYPSLKNAKVVGTYSGLRYVCPSHHALFSLN